MTTSISTNPVRNFIPVSDNASEQEVETKNGSPRKSSNSAEIISEKLPESLGVLNFGSNGAKHLNLANLLMDVQQELSKIQTESANLGRLMSDKSFVSQLDKEKAQALGMKNSAITKSVVQAATGLGTLGAQMKTSATFTKTNATLSAEKLKNQTDINRNDRLASSSTFAAEGSKDANAVLLRTLNADLKKNNSILNQKMGDLNARFESQKAQIQTGQMVMNSGNDLTAAQTRYDAEMHGMAAKKAEKNKQDNNTMAELALAALKQVESNVANLNNLIAQMISHYSGYKA